MTQSTFQPISKLDGKVVVIVGGAGAIGIATAVPALIFYNVLMRNTRLHVTQLEAFAERFLRLALKHRKQWSDA